MQNGESISTAIGIRKLNELASNALYNQLDNAIKNSSFEIILDCINNIKNDNDKNLFTKMINQHVNGISLFAKIVYAMPQNQEKWGYILTQLVLIGADVYQDYPKSYYSIFQRIRLYADNIYFQHLCSYLFTVALNNNNTKRMFSLIAHSPSVSLQIRYHKKEMFYRALLASILKISDKPVHPIVHSNLEKFLIQPTQQSKLKIEQQYVHIVELVKYLHSDNFTSTADKRKYVLVKIALMSRTLCIAKRSSIISEERKAVFEKIFSQADDLLPCISPYFKSEFKKILVAPSLIDTLETKHRIYFNSDINKQISFIFSPLRIAAVNLLDEINKRKPNHTNGITSSAQQMKEIISIIDGKTQLSTDEIYYIKKILECAHHEKSQGLSTLDKDTHEKVILLLTFYIKKNTFQPSSPAQQTNVKNEKSAVTDEEKYKALYVSKFGKLHKASKTSDINYQALYILRINEYEHIETVEGRFNYALDNDLTICLKDLVDNYYFAIDEDWLHKAFIMVIKKRNYNAAHILCTVFPFHIFIIIGEEGKTLWDEIVTRLDIYSEKLILMVLNIIKIKLNIICSSLLPVACAMGQIELIDYFLRKDKKLLKQSDDILLTFNYAQHNHYYDIISKLIKKEKYFNFIKRNINLHDFARSIGEYLYSIITIEALQYMFDIITVEFKKFFVKENLSLPSLLTNRLDLKVWEPLVYGIKSRATFIRQSISELESKATIFEKIDALFQTTIYFQMLKNINEHPSLPSHINVDSQKDNYCSLLKIESKEYSTQSFIQSIELNNIEIATFYFEKLRYTIRQLKLKRQYEYIRVIKIDKIIETLITQIKFGHIVWQTILVQLISLAKRYHLSSIINAEFMHIELLYLLSSDTYHKIERLFNFKNQNIVFSENVCEQSFIRDGALRFETSTLDINHRRFLIINDCGNASRRDNNSLFQQQYRVANKKSEWTVKVPSNSKWRPIYAAYFADTHVISDAKTYFHAYKEKLAFTEKLPLEGKMLSVVKHNLYIYLQLLLEKQSNKINSWDEIDKKAFYTSFENRALNECAKLFINHIAVDQCGVLLAKCNNKMSPAEYIDLHDIFETQVILLNKLFIYYSCFPNRDGSPRLLNIIYLAIVLKLPNSLTNCLVAEIQKTKEKSLLLLASFEFAIERNYVEGIYIFIEYAANCLVNISHELFEKLCLILIREINHIDNLSILKKMLNILKCLNHNLNKIVCVNSLNQAFVNFSMVLKTLEISVKLMLPEQDLTHYIADIKYHFNMPHIEKYLEQLIAITTNADRKSIKQSQSYKNINDQIETALHTDNEIARNQLIAQYPLHFILTVCQNYEMAYKVLLKNNNHTCIIYILSQLVLPTPNAGTVIDIACELNYVEILAYILDQHGFSELLKSDPVAIIETAISKNYHSLIQFYLKHVCNNEIANKINNNLFYLYLGNLIDTATELTTLYDIYTNLLTVYKSFLPTDQNLSGATAPFAGFVIRLQQKVADLLDFSSAYEIEKLCTIFTLPLKNTSYFYIAIIKKINNSYYNFNPMSYDILLNKWVDTLLKNDVLDADDVRFIRIARISIIEKCYQKAQSIAADEVSANITLPGMLKLKLKNSKIVIIIDDKIPHKNLKKHADTFYSEITLQNKFNYAIYAFCENMLNDDMFQLIQLTIELINSYDKSKSTLIEHQQSLCKRIIQLLSRGTKIPQYFHAAIYDALPILVQYKCDSILEIIQIIISSIISDISKPQAADSLVTDLKAIYNEEFLSSLPIQISPETKSIPAIKISYLITQNELFDTQRSELDRIIGMIFFAKVEEKRKYLDAIIKHLESQTPINIISIIGVEGNNSLTLEALLPDIIESIEISLNQLVKQALQKSYSYEDLYIDESTSNSLWYNLYSKNFGLPPNNNTNDIHFYQKIYKLTHLEFFSLLSFEEQFDYCVKHEFVAALHLMVSNIPQLINTKQFHTVLLMSAKFKYYETIKLVLQHVSPFDVFIIYDLSDNCAWTYIDNYQDKFYISLATVILEKIKEYTDEQHSSLMVLAIKYGMIRLALDLLKCPKVPFKENDITIAFQLAINYREYDIATIMISNYFKFFKNSFDIDLNEFYAYLCDEINFVKSIEGIQNLYTKTQSIYKNIFSLDNKSTFFQAHSGVWQKCVNSLEIKNLSLVQNVCQKITIS